MPEGDTVYRAATKLREALVGKALTRCDVRVPKFATVDLTGCVVDEVLSRGKHLFIRVGDASIHSHLKMEGAWLIDGQIRRVPEFKIRILLATADSRAAGVDLGVLEILRRDQDMEAVAHLGPDLLGDDWEPRVARDNLVAEPDRPRAPAVRGPRQRLRQRVVFRHRVSADHPGGRRQGSAADGAAGARHAVAQPFPGQPHHHRRHPRRPGPVGVRPQG
jgi:endonuclease-8